ncbi:MAG TPA: sensor domain-containing diguanylate cyclase [Tepidisphaeraceae bacterium]|nr:sensor domain-containing diguanylate cyclase [Tepidisphaeraceae bacterium]
MGLSDDDQNPRSAYLSPEQLLITLCEINASLARLEEDPKGVLEELARSVCALCGAPAARVEAAAARMHARIGREIPALSSLLAAPSRGAFSQPQDQVIYCDNAGGGAAADAPACRRANIASFALLPLCAGGRVLGALGIASPKVRAFDGSQVAALKVVGALAAQAMLRWVRGNERDALLAEHARAQWLEEDRRQVLEMIAQDHPLPAVLRQIPRLVERQAPRVWPCVMIVQDGAIERFGPSVPADLLEVIGRHPVTFAARMIAGAEAGTSPRMADVETDCAWEGARQAARDAGVRCAWSAAIRARDGVPLGLLVAFCPESREPGVEESALLETAAGLATLAVEHHQTTRQLAHLVRHDALTGLPNRILFEDRLQQALASARRSGKPIGLLALDLNRFKQVNDTLGHQAGDALLQQFAQRLRICLRDTDTLARVGGDEFMLILSEVNGMDDAILVVSRLRDALAGRPFDVGGRALIATASIGIALWPHDGEDAATLQRAADADMYRAKEESRRLEPADAPAAAGPVALRQAAAPAA